MSRCGERVPRRFVSNSSVGGSGDEEVVGVVLVDQSRAAVVDLVGTSGVPDAYAHRISGEDAKARNSLQECAMWVLNINYPSTGSAFRKSMRVQQIPRRSRACWHNAVALGEFSE